VIPRCRNLQKDRLPSPLHLSAAERQLDQLLVGAHLCQAVIVLLPQLLAHRRLQHLGQQLSQVRLSTAIASRESYLRRHAAI